MTHAAFILSVVLAATCTGPAADPESAAATPAGNGETVLRLTVPAATAEHRGTAILMLEDVEIGAGEGMTIEVLGPPDPETRERAILAVSGLVGAPQAELAEPREKMTMAIPLNEAASELLEGAGEIELTLRLQNSPGRVPLKVGRAYLRR